MSPETFVTNDHDVMSLETFETEVTLDSLITIEPLKVSPSANTTKTDITDNTNNSNTNTREVKAEGGKTLLTINTDLLSPVQPSSVLLPLNKEGVEIQLPTTVPLKGNNECGSNDDKAESGLPARPPRRLFNYISRWWPLLHPRTRPAFRYLCQRPLWHPRRRAAVLLLYKVVEGKK